MRRPLIQAIEALAVAVLFGGCTTNATRLAATAQPSQYFPHNTGHSVSAGLGEKKDGIKVEMYYEDVPLLRPAMPFWVHIENNSGHSILIDPDKIQVVNSTGRNVYRFSLDQAMNIATRHESAREFGYALADSLANGIEASAYKTQDPAQNATINYLAQQKTDTEVTAFDRGLTGDLWQFKKGVTVNWLRLATLDSGQTLEGLILVGSLKKRLDCYNFQFRVEPYPRPSTSPPQTGFQFRFTET